MYVLMKGCCSHHNHAHTPSFYFSFHLTCYVHTARQPPRATARKSPKRGRNKDEMRRLEREGEKERTCT